jgi:hypothetical protein
MHVRVQRESIRSANLGWCCSCFGRWNRAGSARHLGHLEVAAVARGGTGFHIANPFDRKCEIH